jgi:hypothetical protein
MTSSVRIPMGETGATTGAVVGRGVAARGSGGGVTGIGEPIGMLAGGAGIGPTSAIAAGISCLADCAAGTG